MPGLIMLYALTARSPCMSICTRLYHCTCHCNHCSATLLWPSWFSVYSDSVTRFPSQQLETVKR
uniref:Uncharacterized protein n=1 Tax=Arundo donax TaxID=35708 RepID=A0A0A9CZT0_ARUDO